MCIRKFHPNPLSRYEDDREEIYTLTNLRIYNSVIRSTVYLRSFENHNAFSRITTPLVEHCSRVQCRAWHRVLHCLLRAATMLKEK